MGTHRVYSDSGGMSTMIRKREKGKTKNHGYFPFSILFQTIIAAREFIDLRDDADCFAGDGALPPELYQSRRLEGALTEFTGVTGWIIIGMASLTEATSAAAARFLRRRRLRRHHHLYPHRLLPRDQPETSGAPPTAPRPGGALQLDVHRNEIHFPYHPLKFAGECPVGLQLALAAC